MINYRGSLLVLDEESDDEGVIVHGEHRGTRESPHMGLNGFPVHGDDSRRMWRSAIPLLGTGDVVPVEIARHFGDDRIIAFEIKPLEQALNGAHELVPILMLIGRRGQITDGP